MSNYRIGYNVYRNDQFILFIEGRSFKACQSVIREGRVSIGTHMGEWRRTLTIKPEKPSKACFEREYATTVGVYIKFQPAMQEFGS